jgi:light-regulated signal transduction histidine kinase (bacteriophytochrome)
MTESDGRYEEENWRLRKDGSWFWASVVTTAVRDDAGHLTGFAKIVRDVTGRRRAEELAEAKALEEHTVQLQAANTELETFSYSISHDLRAPLRAIDGFSRILLEDYGDQFSNDAKDYLNSVRSNAQQMGRMVDSLLALARLNRQPIKKQTVDSTQLVRKCLAELRGEQDERRAQIIMVDLPPCYAEPTLIEQVWTNLLANALKYTRNCEVATIEIGSMGDDDPAGEVTYFVKDNGVGFDMRYVSKLFGVFQRLHRAEDFEGTGVGLATVQRIVQRHGGRVWANAQPKQGATFFFTLGASEPHA